ncbi:MAG: hypothetical protein NDJ92_20880 [Thermoanaerobaculia bacterium]|nr:hypothetical protein [Thermoanaerobaculia bacterium]
MKKMTGILFLALLAAGCSSTSMVPNESATGAAELSGKRPSYYRLVSDPLPIREIDWGRPLTDLHVKGHLTNKGFVPLTKVEGSGRLCESGNDWVSLADGAFHKGDSGEAPTGPYIKGCKGRSGGFMPASKEVQVN